MAMRTFFTSELKATDKKFAKLSSFVESSSLKIKFTSLEDSSDSWQTWTDLTQMAALTANTKTS
jgi:hypothetical protein